MPVPQLSTLSTSFTDDTKRHVIKAVSSAVMSTYETLKEKGGLPQDKRDTVLTTQTVTKTVTEFVTDEMTKTITTSITQLATACSQGDSTAPWQHFEQIMDFVLKILATLLVAVTLGHIFSGLWKAQTNKRLDSKEGVKALPQDEQAELDRDMQKIDEKPGGLAILRGWEDVLSWFKPTRPQGERLKKVDHYYMEQHYKTGKKTVGNTSYDVHADGTRSNVSSSHLTTTGRRDDAEPQASGALPDDGSGEAAADDHSSHKGFAQEVEDGFKHIKRTFTSATGFSQAPGSTKSRASATSSKRSGGQAKAGEPSESKPPPKGNRDE